MSTINQTTAEMREARPRRDPLEDPPKASSGAEILRADAAEIASIVAQANRMWPGINAEAAPFLAAGWGPDRVRKHLLNHAVDKFGGEEISNRVMPDASNTGTGWDAVIARTNGESGG